jgi:RloB-like protein
MSKGKPRKPQSPKVVALLEQLRRRTGFRDLQLRHLIVCEDDKSAPNYFRALKEWFKVNTSIQVVPGGGRTQPIQVVTRAIEILTAAASEESGTLPFDDVWCVIDGDYGSEISKARAKAIANDVKLVVSTPCFEYWVLLHFLENSTPVDKCSEVVRALRATPLGKYEKGKCDFGPVVKLVKIAAERAKRLRSARIQSAIFPENHNPCSELYLLVDQILSDPAFGKN